MAGINIDFTIANQKGTPAFYSDIFANRPTFGYPGRVFISTDTGAIYEDTGTSWTLIADAGAGTTGTLQQVTTNGNTTTLGILVQGLTIGRGGSDINTNTAIGSSALTSNTTGTGNVALGYNALLSNTIGTNNISIGRASFQGNLSGSSNTIIGDGSAGGITSGNTNICIGASSGAGLVAGSYNTIIGSYGGADTSNYIVLADGQGNARMYSNGSGLIGINQSVGTPSGQLDIHSAETHALVLNGTGTSNAYISVARAGTNQWRIGNTYNAGANTFDIYNFGTTSTALSFNKTTNNATFIGNVTASSLVKSGGTSAQILAGDGSVITAGTNITISGGTISSSSGGSITLGAVGTTPNANGMTLTGSVLNLEPASISFPGILTTGTQTINGIKTFNTQIVSPNAIAANGGITSTLAGQVVYSTTSGASIGILGSSSKFELYGNTSRFTIRGDDASTFNNNFAFIGSGTNLKTEVDVIPNGTGTTSGWIAYNNSSKTTSAYAQIGISSTTSYVNSGIRGAGTQLPLAFQLNGVTKASILTAGTLSLVAGTTAGAQINLASSTAPTSPNNGDIWFDGTNLLMRIGGVTKTFTIV